MGNENLTQTAPTTTETKVAPVQANEPQKLVSADDIITRSSAFKVQPETTPNGTQETKFNFKDIEKITDPVAKKWAEDAYKSFQADHTRKTQEIAEQRRNLESAQSLKSKNFTLNDVDELLNNPTFIQAAQEKQKIAQPQQTMSQNGNAELTEEEFSYLTPEMQKVYLQQKQTKDMVAQLTGKLQSAEIEKEDMTLKTRYTNYSPESVNQIYRDMMSGKINATREHLWKVLDYEDMAKRVYQLGRQDEKQGISQARQASTQVNGVTTQTLDSDIPTRLKNESFQDHWKRLAQAAKTKLGQ